MLYFKKFGLLFLLLSASLGLSASDSIYMKLDSFQRYLHYPSSISALNELDTAGMNMDMKLELGLALAFEHFKAGRGELVSNSILFELQQTKGRHAFLASLSCELLQNPDSSAQYWEVAWNKIDDNAEEINAFFKSHIIRLMVLTQSGFDHISRLVNTRQNFEKKSYWPYNIRYWLYLSQGYYLLGDFENAIRNSEHGIQFLESEELPLEDVFYQAYYLNLSNSHYQLGNEEKFKEYNYRARALALKMGDKKNLATIISNLYPIYLKEGKLDSAKDVLLRALDVYKKHGLYEGQIRIYYNLTDLSLIQGLSDTALEYSIEALKLLHDSSSSQGAIIFFGLARSHHAIGHTDSAIHFYNLAYSAYKANSFTNAYLYFLYSYAEFLRSIGQSDKANNVLFEYVDVSDSLFSTDVSKRVLRLTSKHELELKQKEIETQEQIISKEKRIKLFMTLSIVLTMSILIVIVVSRVKLKNRNKELRQINQRIRELINELNHRTKNNYQFLSSLFSLQLKEGLKNPKDLIQESKTRIDALLLLQQKLTYEETNESIEASEFFKDLIENLIAALNLKPDQIQLATSEVRLGTEQALSLALIMTELVFNSIKHCAEKKENFHCHISLQLNEFGRRSFIYSDSCTIEFDSNKQTKGTGLKLIASLVRQLDGESSVSFNPEFIWQLTF